MRTHAAETVGQGTEDFLCSVLSTESSKEKTVKPGADFTTESNTSVTRHPGPTVCGKYVSTAISRPMYVIPTTRHHHRPLTCKLPHMMARLLS